MRTIILVAVALLGVLTLAGCLEDITAGYNDLTQGWFAEDTALAATIAEIDAVAKLNSDSAKYEGFKVIAARVGLPTEAQVHLVKPVFGKLYAESDKEDVLITLIDNPGFTCAAKLAILKRLDTLSSQTSRIAILKQITERRDCQGRSEQIEVEIEIEEKHTAHDKNRGED